MALADRRRRARGVDGARLRRLLAERAGLELSAASIVALMTKQPAQLKLSTLGSWCTALECSPNDLLEVDITPVEAKPKPARTTQAPAKARPGTVDATTVRLADCVRRGGGIGFKNETLCHRCRPNAKRPEPTVRSAASSSASTLTPAAVCAARELCGIAVRSCASRPACVVALAGSEPRPPQASPPCPRCGRAALIRAVSGWWGSCSRRPPPAMLGVWRARPQTG